MKPSKTNASAPAKTHESTNPASQSCSFAQATPHEYVTESVEEIAPVRFETYSAERVETPRRIRSHWRFFTRISKSTPLMPTVNRGMSSKMCFDFVITRWTTPETCPVVGPILAHWSSRSSRSKVRIQKNSNFLAGRPADKTPS
jgi:hypothetical protein